MTEREAIEIGHVLANFMMVRTVRVGDSVSLLAKQLQDDLAAEGYAITPKPRDADTCGN